MPELPSEPSVSTVKKGLEQPITDEQAKLLQKHLENPPQTTQAEFLSNLESYPSVFPDAVTTYFMKKQGLETADPRVVRMISLATQKFVSDVILDSMMQAKIKGHTSKPGKPVVLTEELLMPVMKDRGLDIQKPPYHM